MRAWPFQKPEVLEAVDGQLETPPPGWRATKGAYGCKLSWLKALDESIAGGMNKPILIMEDDCQFVEGAMDRMKWFFERLPNKWQIAFLGCQHMRPYRLVRPGIVRVGGAERTHCLTIAPHFFRELRNAWAKYNSHIDHCLRDMASSHYFYAANPVLAIQGTNVSQIVGGRSEPARAWDEQVEIRADGKAYYKPGNADIRLEKPLRSDKPEVFYHIACMGNWREVVQEQLDLVKEVGLTRINSGILGTTEERDTIIEWAVNRGILLSVFFNMPDTLLYEIPTLQGLQSWAKSNPNSAVLYFHTKGVSQPQDPNKPAWRRLMSHYIIKQWKENMGRLTEADAVGVDWQDSNAYPHFSGTFFMARTDWINVLPDIVAYQKRHPGTRVCGNPWERMVAELWVGSVPNHQIESLVCRNVDLYRGLDVFRLLAETKKHV